MKTKVIAVSVFALVFATSPALANQASEAEKYAAAQRASAPLNLCYDQKDDAIRSAHNEYSRIWESLAPAQRGTDEYNPSTALGASLVRWMNLKAERESVCRAIFNQAYDNALAAIIAARPIPTPTPTVVAPVIPTPTPTPTPTPVSTITETATSTVVSTPIVTTSTPTATTAPVTIVETSTAISTTESTTATLTIAPAPVQETVTAISIQPVVTNNTVASLRAEISSLIARISAILARLNKQRVTS